MAAWIPRRIVAQWGSAGLLISALMLLANESPESAIGAQATPTSERFAVDDRGGDQRNPRIDGAWVVWEDYRRSTGASPTPTVSPTPSPTPIAGVPTATSVPTATGEPVTWLADIRARNIQTTQDSRRITDTENAERPVISGTIAVWTEQKPDGGRDLVVYDVQEREVVRRIERPGDQDYAAISGRKIVWQDNRNVSWDIRMYDLDTRDESVVHEGEGDQARPSIQGNLVAWEDNRDGGRIWYKDLSTGSVQRIENLSAAYEPAVNGKYIAFRAGGTQDTPQDAGIYLFDTTTRSFVQISSTLAGKRGNPAISASLVVWWDERRGDRDIWAYDLTQGGADFAVNQDDANQDKPAVSAATVVWTDERGSDRDIRGARVGLMQPTPTPGPATSTPQVAPPPGAVPHDERYFPITGFRINNDRFWEYFNLRGRERTFGYPISREFTFLGFTVQFFQGHIMQLMPDGRVATMNLLQEGLMPATRVNGSTFPASDPALLGSAPQVGQPNYAEQIVEFTRQNAPNDFNGRPVRFFDTFVSTVDLATAFPGGGGSASLLPLLNLEIWGVVTSRPLADPSNPDFIYQRYQRSIMHYRQSCQCTERILLADWFKTVITGRGLPGDLAQDMASSPYIRQYDNNSSDGRARPSELSATNMRFAFEPQ